MVVSFTIGSKSEVDANGGLARVAALSSTTAIALYSSATSGIEARFLTRSGTSLSGGTVLTIDANQADSITICKLSATSAVIGYAYGATHRVRVLTVSGTTLTANAITNMTDTGVDYLSCQFLDTNKIIYVYTDSSGNGRSVALTISGTTITENALYTWFSAGISTAALNVVEVIDTTTALVGYAFDPGSPSSSFYELLDITGTTITTLDSLGNVGALDIDLTATLDLSVSDSDPNFVYFSYIIDSGKNIRFGLIDCTGGALAIDFAIGGIAGTYNCASLVAMYLDSGASSPYDVVLFVQNDSSGNNLYIYAEDQWSGDSDSDSTITTTASTGSIQVRKFDDDYAIVVFNESTESLVVSFASAPILSLPSMTKPADMDATGSFIYLSVLDSGTPILIKIAEDLSADGTTIFDPGAGDNIGVECGRFNSDVVWVAGQFDGTNVVEKSEDGGISFTVKDDATIGGVRSFVMGPDSDNRILVFDEDNGDILETRDNGGTWTTINASVTPEINAIARLGENVEESVFGNDGGANNSINYSVNSGDDLEDFQTGVYPATNATRVIVN